MSEAATTTALVTLAQDKKFLAQFNARRLDKTQRLAMELEYIKAAAAKDEKIYDCTILSVQNVLFQLTATGLSFNPTLKQAYPIRYGQELTLCVGYQGLAHLCYKAGILKALNVALVYTHDDFQVETIANRRVIRHTEFMGKDRGEVTHCYCIADFTNGGQHVEVMSAYELEQCEKAASIRNPKGGAVWRGPFRSQMLKKSTIRRAWNYWPRDDGGALEHAQKVMDDLEPATFTTEPETPPEKQELLVSPEQIEQLRQVCRDLDLPEHRIETNLQLLADSFRAKTITDLPARFYDDAAAKLTARLQERQRKIAEKTAKTQGQYP